MTEKMRLAFILVILAALALPMQSFSAQEDSAQLVFTKKAASKKPLYTYKVQKGEMLSAIIRRIPDITEKDIPAYYRLVKELNPKIESLDKLQAGQEIVLPGKPLPVPSEKTVPQASGTGTASAEASGSQEYRIRKGDSLIRIVHRELQITSKTQPVLLMIKSLNPSVQDANKIYEGQVIHLPDSRQLAAAYQTQAKGMTTRRPPMAEKSDARAAKDIQEQTDNLSSDHEQKNQADSPLEGKDAPILPPAERLAVIKHIIYQMNGSMMTSGKYYLPVSQKEQLTVDCSVFPLVELDGTTILLDQGNRTPWNLKKMIGDRWGNHHMIKMDPKDDIVTLLKKILKQTRSYTITKAQKPATVDASARLDVTVDWIITHKDPRRQPAVQGLRFAYEQDSLLPRAVVNYARKHSLFITEISPEKGLVGKPAELYSLAPITTLPKSSAKEFSYALLSLLNIKAEKDVDIRVFNIQKEGFNLSIKADLLISRDQKQYILVSRSLPPQFVSVLQKEGNEIINVSDQDDPAKTMETILKAFGIAHTSGYFSFSGLDKNQPPYTVGFNGTKIKTDKDLYIVNFDFNEDLRGLLNEKWSASVVRY